MSAVAPEFEIRVGESRQDAPLPRKRLVARIAIALVSLWLLSGFYLVPPDQQAVETMFGQVVAPRVMPGLHYALPWPIERVAKLKVRQLQRLVVGGDPQDSVLGRTQPLKTQFLTGDQNIINLRVVVQYSVGVPADYLFQTQSPPEIVGAAVETELARRVAHHPVDAVLTTEKIAIQDEVRSAAQSLLDSYHCGVRLSTINIEIAAPPAEAAEAFRDVASARADTSRIESAAQGYANGLLPRARGEASQMAEAAQGYKEKKIDEAIGDASRFSQIAAEYAKAPQITRSRLYLEAMEQILPRIKKVVMDKNGNVDLTIIRRSDPQAVKGNP